MSLDVNLNIGEDNVFTANITHNLTEMAGAADLYWVLWHPESIGIQQASKLVPFLERGIALLENDPPRFRKMNSRNGWGLYEHFVPWVRNYLDACRTYPEAEVRTSV